MKTPSLLRSLMSFSGMTFISRLLGLVREVAMSAAFGAGMVTDAFNVAFRIPNFLRRLFAEGSFSLAFVPVLTEVKEKESPEALRELVARTAGTLGAILLVVTAVGVIGADWLVRLFAAGAVDEPEKFALTVSLLRVTFPFLLFVSLTALAGAVLNAHHRFALPALAPVILNLCWIVAALWLAPYFEVPIMAVGWAIFASGVLQLLFLLPSLARLNMLAWPRWGWSHPRVKRIRQVMIPTLFGSSVAQVNLLLDTLIASYLITGSQTWLGQSDRLLEFPLGLFGVALGTVILPSLSRHHVSTDAAAFSRALDWGLRTALLIAMPAMLGLVLLAEPLVATLFLHGKFTPHDVAMAGLSLSALSFGLPAFVLIKVVAPAFYSRGDTRTPVRAGVVAMAANMLFNLVLVAILFACWHQPADLEQGWVAALARVPGLHMALAVASALAGYLNLAQLWRALVKTGVYQAQPGWGRHLRRVGLACLAMSAVVLLGDHYAADWTRIPTWQRAGQLGALVVAAAAVYLAALLVQGFRLRELRAH